MKVVEQSVELIDSMGSDLSVVNAARVSFHKESDWDTSHITHENQFQLNEKDQRLLAYLAKYNHWSPFAHTSLQFRIKAPIFVARQLVKHQVGGVWNEVSRRYVDDEPEFYFPATWRGRPTEGAKQGSSEEVITHVFRDKHTPIEIGFFITKNVEWALDAYKEMLNSGIAPEQARMVLPQNTMTEWIWTGSLYFFARVCNLRLDPHAQAETREIAQKINDLIPKGFKHSWQALVH